MKGRFVSHNDKDSIFKKDWFQFTMFFIWLTAVSAGPTAFCDSGIWICCGIGGGLIGLIILKVFLKDLEASLAAHHLYALLGYCLVSIMLIGFSKEATYESMKDLGRCSIFYSAVTFIIWIVESIYKKKKAKLEWKEEWENLKKNTRIEVGRLFVKVKWNDDEHKPRLRHIIKPIIESEDVWEIISIDNEDVTLQSCIEDRVHIDKYNESWYTPEIKIIRRNDLLWYYADVSNVFDTYCGENDLLKSYEQTIEQLKKKEAIIKQWVQKMI